MTESQPREKLRVSSDRKDKGFRADHHRFDAWLDGVKLKYCITADEVMGWALCASLNDKGVPLAKADGSGFFTVEYRGAIEIRRSDR